MSTIHVAPAASSWTPPIFNTKGGEPTPSVTAEISTEELTYLGICVIAILSLIGTFLSKRKS